MDPQPLPIRRLLALARPESFAENTLVILRRLGCLILTPGEFAQDACDRDEPSAVPDLYVAEAARLSEIPAVDPVSPIVLLSHEGEPRVEDARLVAEVRSPVGMHDLYRVVQELLEENPRSTPRVRTALPAVCRASGRQWSGSVVSLSENGCLLRTDETIELGTELQVSVKMGDLGKVSVRAETAYQIKSELGLVFSSTWPKIRLVINEFVTRALLAAEDRDSATPAATG
jgi:hypothetical protein